MRVLAAAARAADQGHGSVVLVSGEAGVGKTSLVRAFPSWVPAGVRVLTGYCDALSTPRALGPMKDIAANLGPEFRSAVQAGDRDLVMSALVVALDSGPTTVLVVEDLHWADEGTLDVLRYAARRIPSLHALLVVTFRDDETGTGGTRAPWWQPPPRARPPSSCRRCRPTRSARCARGTPWTPMRSSISRRATPIWSPRSWRVRRPRRGR